VSYRNEAKKMAHPCQVLCLIYPHPTPVLFFSSILSIVIVCDADG